MAERPEITTSLLKDGQIEAALKLMREAGLSQVACLRACREVLDLSLAEADHMVLYSETWADQLENNFRLRDAFLEALDELDAQDKEPGGVDPESR